MKPTASEIKNIQIARKSLVAKKSISAGDIFSIENLVAKRPENGISPMEFPKLDGKTSDRNYSEDETIVMPGED
jgi:sialic acid synthase SpsE